ncbi:MAG: hypothetical protein AAFS10_13410, partial [Myxococcota bacterium]
MTTTHETSQSSADIPHHIAPQRPTRPYMERILAAVGGGLEQVRSQHGLRSVELMVGFSGRLVAPLVVQADAHGLTGRV